jgi:hypothetical protein
MEARLRQLEAIAPDPKPAKKDKKTKKKKGGDKKAAGGKKKRRRAETPGIEATELIDIGIRGDASKVLLVDGANRYPLPAVVPPGDYEIHAAFESMTLPEKVATLSAGDSAVVIVSCDKDTRGCEAINR